MIAISLLPYTNHLNLLSKCNVILELRKAIQAEYVAEYYDPNTFCSLHFYAALWPHAELPYLQITKESSEVTIFPIDELPDDMAFTYQKDIILQAAEHFTARGQ